MMTVAVVGAGPAGALAGCPSRPRRRRGDGLRRLPSAREAVRRRAHRQGARACCRRRRRRTRCPALACRCRFESGGGDAVDVASPRPVGRWPRAWSSTAGCCGARWRLARGTWRSASSASKPRAACDASGRDETFDAIVGADGAGSLVRRTLPGPDSARAADDGGGLVRGRRFGDGRALHSRPAGLPLALPAARARRGRDLRAAGPRAHRAHAGPAAHRSGARLPRPRSTQEAPRYAHTIPSPSADPASIAEIGGERWGLLGDAAALADPITGEGIYYALRSAEVLAETLREDGVLRRYPERALSSFGARAAEGGGAARALLRAGLRATGWSASRPEAAPSADVRRATSCWGSRDTTGSSGVWCSSRLGSPSKTRLSALSAGSGGRR